MIPVDQQYIDGDGKGRPGDCVRACLASILEIPREDIPHFADPAEVGQYWLDALCEWAEGRSLWCTWRDGATWPVSGPHLPLCIAVGKSPRGIPHAVVADAETGELLHDPHPSRSMFSTPVQAQIVFWRQQ